MNVHFSPRREPGPDLSCLQLYNEWLACRHKTSLLPMKEDLAIWLNRILGLDITADNLMDSLDTGVVLCQLAEELQEKMILADNGKPFIRHVIRWRADATAGSFFARDNAANFLYWCCKIGMAQSHLFESEDLVLQKHPRDVCLCLMQLGRIASRYGVEPPALVKLEREIEKDESLSPSMFFDSPFPSPSNPPLFLPPDPDQLPIFTPSPLPTSISSATPSASPTPSPPLDPYPSPPLVPTPPPELISLSSNFSDSNTKSEPQTALPTIPSPISTPVKSPPSTPTNCITKTNGKKSTGCLLDQIVRQISEDPPCKCPVKFCIEKQPKGHYRVGDKVLYVRMLNDKHAMVRVGGGWETFGTYLLKHDPCRMTVITRPGTKTCKSNGKSPVKREQSRDSYLVVGTHSHFKK
ncbi:growth arrest-specific protein 2-like [Myxocyprinus asiaticus]|uniref:growth arrest-specific protein 2-like n=1 Tax=Myxocyprinus asiaticus TaxID=70543 RepID=UPI002223B956|nr:growth arrest-specific protein 2-like [Myxocyprinus asiaticus]XP_051510677.1 growth arrest-specific protein 2-like [Myxocyprinus asiaticus]